MLTRVMVDGSFAVFAEYLLPRRVAELRVT